ncbi:PA0069 family radical SAM protein [Thalassococcus lentus]|uniref:PA0069 family radical SAM protein n=1 Tax=Thalassococcus lentus TaxID=1210524 RepID=A0ABT4XRJ0_9RHOB|nr:PA0069 family radical SAM protein [Thalassococcus lentus]MDA7424555.1 PA0069 family radical SAM protein [Thalassococcus lentus]
MSSELPKSLRPVPKEQRRGRGAISRNSGRYERFTHADTHDGWDIPEDRPILRTQVSLERPRSAITYQRSPDLPFDRSINPYRGCEHGCIYCFARPTHAYLGLSPGLDFETRLIARPAISEVLAQELRRKSYRVAPLAIGTNTDPYQPIEQEQEVTRSILSVLAAHRHPVAIVTKGSLIERDIDILSDMAKQGLARVGISVTTLDRKLSRSMEPRVPDPERRLKTIRRLVEAGIPVRVMASPIVPALTDPELEAILEAGAEAGATSASWIMLRLPLEVAPLWREWLVEHYPDRAERVLNRLREMHDGKLYSAQWHTRMRGDGPYAQMIDQRFRHAARRLALNTPQPALRSDLFAVPPRRGDQLSLF